MPFNNEVNEGGRFVDTQQTFFQISQVHPNTITPPQRIAAFLDCTQSLSFNLVLTPTIPSPTAVPATLEFTLLWFSVDQSTIICQQTYEINACQNTGGDMITTYIQGICRGAYCSIYLTGKDLNPGMGSITQLNGIWSTSSRPLSSEHIFQGTTDLPPVVDSLNMSTEGTLFVLPNLTLGAGASSGVFSAALTNKDIFVAIGASNGNWRLRGGWGAGAIPPSGFNPQINLLTGVAGATNQPSFIFGPYKSPTRPLQFTIANIATASGTVNAQIWTQGAD